MVERKKTGRPKARKAVSVLYDFPHSYTQLTCKNSSSPGSGVRTPGLLRCIYLHPDNTIIILLSPVLTYPENSYIQDYR